MKQIHKKALLIAALLCAVLAGVVLALFPTWGQHREEQKQEAMILRIQEVGKKEEAEGPSMSSEPAATSSEAASCSAEHPDMEPVTSVLADRETAAGAAHIPEEGAEIGILSIPRIEAELPVTAGVSEEQLKVSEGWVRQTDRIGSEGNAVIAGHRSYTFGKHFNRLEELEKGDEIFFTTVEGETMRFAVSETLTVGPDDPVVFALPTDGGARLTLYTCTPIKIATHRLIVRALLLEE